MARRPLELQSMKWPFVGLAVLIALTTAWSVYDEVVPRRPWKNYQREFFRLEEAHLRADRDRAQKRLDAPENKKQLDALHAGVDDVIRHGERPAAIDRNQMATLRQAIRKLFGQGLEAAIAGRNATSAKNSNVHVATIIDADEPVS